MTRSLFLCMLLTGLQPLVYGQGNAALSIDKVVPMNDFSGGPRDDGVAIVVGNSAFFGTGNNQYFEVQNDWWQYDQLGDSWIRKADVPGLPRQYSLGFTNEKQVFLVGGIFSNGQFSDQLIEYDIELDAWQVYDTPLNGRAQMAGFRVGSCFYVAGGRNDSIVFQDFWRFDMSSKNWTRLDDLPFGPRYEASGFSYQEKGYLCLGGDSAHYYAEVWKYNAPSNDWTQLANYPGRARSYAAVAETHTGVIVMGGQSDSADLLSEIYYFHSASETWEKENTIKMPEIRGANAFVLESECFLIGGLTLNFTRIDSVLKFEFTEAESDPQILLAPNPARDVVYVFAEQNREGQWMHLEIVDASGRVHLSEAFYAREISTRLNVENLRDGIYFLRMSSNTDRFVRRLVVIK